MPTYLEDLTPGAELRSAGRTMTESDIMAFAGVSGDFNRLHTDEPWVREHTPFEGRIAHGLLVLAISSGLATPGLDDVEIIAYLEETRRFTGPTYPGDTIHSLCRIAEVRPSGSRPTMGVVSLEVVVRNQRDDVVQSGNGVWLVARRPKAS